MLSTLLKILSQPSHSQMTPGLCLASWRARSFLLEKPPPVACGQPSCRQKNDLVCRLWCLRKSQPRVKTALEVQPGYAQVQVPFLFRYPYARRSGELLLGEMDREYSAPTMLPSTDGCGENAPVETVDGDLSVRWCNE